MSVSTAIPPAPHPKHLAAISNHDPPTVNAQAPGGAPGQVDHSGGPGGCVVSIGARVEKLPLGQSLVTLVRENDANFQPVIQIKVGFNKFSRKALTQHINAAGEPEEVNFLTI